ncbi:MAG: class I SAM-dependent methyltransferase [Candidatus Thorarchaeota archaeon]|nr:class I SAM-dependent methyltransferase [Candidatus Thorarchaeota archaeon]
MVRVKRMNYYQGYDAIAEYYDLFAENDDIAFYRTIADEYGGPVLDLAAGTGRIAIALAQAGHTVTALEISPAMREIMRGKRAKLDEEQQSQIKIVEGNMIDFDIGMQFSTIIIPASFGHAMTTEEQISLLKSVRKHLTKDGIFVLDLFPGGAMPEHAEFENGPVQMTDGRIVTKRGIIDCDYVSHLLRLQLTYSVRLKDGSTKTIECETNAAIIFNREANLLIKMAGLQVIEEYGAFDRRPYSPDCGRRILLLQHH